MVEIYKNLFVGSLSDFEQFEKSEENHFIQACKEPCHRNAVGYSTRSLSNTHPEYLYAYRKNRLVLNIIDSTSPKYFSNILFKKSLQFLEENLKDNNKVLIHCNKGISRSPSIGLLYLAVKDVINNKSFKGAKSDFLNIYPLYNPKGIQEFLDANWLHYFNY